MFPGQRELFPGLGNLLLVPRPTRVVLKAKDSRTWRVDLKAKDSKPRIVAIKAKDLRTCS